MRRLLVFSLACAACSRTSLDVPRVEPAPHGVARTTYHFDAARTGWLDDETTLTPVRVQAGLALAWTTGPLEAANVAYTDAQGVAHADTFPARLFATPLYLDDVPIAAGPFAGLTTSIVVAATTNDWVYAVAAVDSLAGASLVQAGTILWRARVGTPAYVPKNDHGIPLGVLSTPIVDATATPPTVYVTAIDASAGWQAFALDVRDGSTLPGWPVRLDPATVSAADRNVPTGGGPPPPMADATVVSQRAALALVDGTLIVGFGSYFDGAMGWVVAVDVASRRVQAAFSGSPVLPQPDPADPMNLASAGVWGAGGPSIASDGRVFVTTGNSPAHDIASPGVWGNSLLAFRPDLTLSATYTPFDYCLLDAGDTDIGGSSPVTFDVDPSRTTTPHLAAFGGKQGVVYLVDRDHMGGGTLARPACVPSAGTSRASTDTSLYGPTPRPEYSPPEPGPLPVFGPYSEAPDANDIDHAKMRTTPALFRPASGDVFVYVAGATKVPGDLATATAPGLARLKVHLAPGDRAYYEPDFATNGTTVLQNPGAPIVTSHDGGADAVVWVLDQNQKRTDPIDPVAGFVPREAAVYAFDATTLQTLWRSPQGSLGPSGKYAHVAVAHGRLYVATDSVTAFAPR